MIAEYKDPDGEARQRLISASLGSIMSIVERRADKESYCNPRAKRFRNVLDGWLAIARAVSGLMYVFSYKYH